MAKPAKTRTRSPASKKTRPAAPRPAPKSAVKMTAEYIDYLERYEMMGAGRPHLSPEEFDRYDDELLDLLAHQAEFGHLSDEQIVRLQELEYLLLEE
jgi:hypothetical protein